MCCAREESQFGVGQHEQFYRDLIEALAWVRGTQLERQIQGLEHGGVSLLVGSSSSDADIPTDIL